jgi:hypothetical protein
MRLARFFPSSLYTRLYIFTCLFETVADIVIELYLLLKLQFFSADHKATVSGDKNSANDEGQTVMPVYLALFVIAHFFQLVLAWEAVLSRNTIQVVGLTLFNGAFLIYAIIQVSWMFKSIGSKGQIAKCAVTCSRVEEKSMSRCDNPCFDSS